MSSRPAQLTLLAGTLTMGHIAGVFGVYAYAFMPGLRKTDDHTFVAGFQEVDRAIVGPWLMLSFVGALVCTAAAVVLHRRSPAVRWIAVALAVYVVAFGVTLAVNVPLNDDLKATGNPDTIDVTAARSAFHEGRWVAWNLVRTITATIGFCCLAWALTLPGRDEKHVERARSVDAFDPV